jgi:hypothetical protein
MILAVLLRLVTTRVRMWSTSSFRLLRCALTVQRNLYTTYPEIQTVHRFRGSLIKVFSSCPE